MLKESEKSVIKEKVLNAYKTRYPEWTGVAISEISENRIFGVLVSICSDQYSDGEICVYSRKGDEVFIFDSTPQLLNHIDKKASRLITTKEVLAFIVVVWMLGIFTGMIFYFRDENAIALVTTSIAGILGTYAGIRISRGDSD